MSKAKGARADRISWLLPAIVLVSSFTSVTPAAAQGVPNADAIHVCAVMRARDGQETALKRALQSLVAPTHAEAGNIAYELYETKDGAIFLHEAWKSQASLDQHLARPNLIEFIAKMPSLIDGANDAHFGQMISSRTNPGLAETANTINVCSFKQPKNGKANELKAALLSLVAPTSAETGYLTYNLYEESNGSLFLFEQWRSKEDFDRHLATRHVQAFRKRINTLAADDRVFVGAHIAN